MGFAQDDDGEVFVNCATRQGGIAPVEKSLNLFPVVNGITIKLCGVTRPEDAEAALELGVDYLGVNRYPKSPRFVDEPTARDLCNRIPAGKRVMVDVNTGTDELDDQADLGFDAFQIHFDTHTSLATVAAWSGIVGADALWAAPRLPEDEQFPQAILEFADTVLLDAHSKDVYGGSGQIGDWARFAELSTLYQHKRWVLAGGLSPANIAQAIAASGASFIDVNSGVEAEPGIKDHAKLRELFAVLAELG